MNQIYPRLIQPVIDRIIAELPDADRWKDLQEDLKFMLTQQMYIAPEAQNWNGLCHILNCYLPTPPETDWQKRIMKIIRNEEI